MKYIILYFVAAFSVFYVTAHQKDTLIKSSHSGIITGASQTDALLDSILKAHQKRLTEQAKWFDSANKALNPMRYYNEIHEEQERKKDRNLIIWCSLIGAIVSISVLLYDRYKRKARKDNT